jgi:hypothetical protein
MKAVQASNTDQVRIGPLQIAIILLTLATAFIHLVVLNAMMLANPEYGQIDLLFTLNGIGYLVLLAALYLPVPVARDNRSLVRYALIGFAALTIVAWIILGRPYDTLGYITKLIELALIVLLFIEGRR